MRELLILAGCVLSLGCVAIGTVHGPIELVPEASDEQIEIEPPPGIALTKSIGEELVLHSTSVLVVECCSTLLARQIPLAGWRNTFVHADRNGYSNREFYGGQIGLVVDEDLNVLRWIQIGGLRRWRQGVVPKAPLFLRNRTTISQWWLRYGGETDGNYRFEIVERPGDNQSEVIQPVLVSQAKFLEGFFVRGIGVQGLRPDHRGTIEYRTFEASESRVR